MTRRQSLAAAIERLQQAGVEDARASAEWLLEHTLGVRRAELVARPDEPVPDEATAAFDRAVERRAAGEPAQYIVGRIPFRGITLNVTPAVLIPRPETEEVTGELLRRLEGRPEPWVLDVGTGSGAIALAVKQERPDAEVFACDVSLEALDVAAANAERLGLDVAFAPADALAPDFAAGRPAAFDAIVANPPYVTESERDGLQREVRDWEPAGALFVPGNDPLLFYRALAAAALRLLKLGGFIVVETHADHGEAVRALFDEAGLANASLTRDLAGRDRIVAAERAVGE